MNFKKLINSMSLKQKLAQMTQLNAFFLDKNIRMSVTGPDKELGVDDELASTLGSVLNFDGLDAVKKIQKEHLEQDPNKIPLLFMLDVVHGDKTIYPIPIGIGATFDLELAYKLARMEAIEARSEGIHVAFSPMVDLVRDPRWGRCMETTGEDPYLNYLMGYTFVKGLQEDLKHTGVIACPKHFAAYGASESGKDYMPTDMSDRMLHDYYLKGYKGCVDAGSKMIMTSFNSLNGVPMCVNKHLLKNILRDNWHFSGTIITDYRSILESINMGYSKNEKIAALNAINTSTDIEMMSTTYYNNIDELINEKKVSIQQIDEAVERVLLLKDELGLFDNPYYVHHDSSILMCKEHLALAKEACVKSCVLLKNDNILPISKNTKNILVIGPFADKGMNGNWACHGRENESVTLLEGIKNYYNGKVTFAKGFSKDLLSDDYSYIEEAVNLAKDADIIICALGEDSLNSGESFSRSNLNLSNAQLKLLYELNKINNNIISLIYSGRPLTLTNMVSLTKGLVEVWQPGTEGGNGIAELLFGIQNFQGKLPMTFPRSVGQIPIYYNQLKSNRPKWSDDGAFTDYSYCSFYQDEYNKPLYHFGYGLSYSTFEIDNLKLSSNKMKANEIIKVSCTIKNTSSVDGVETVQLYINDEFASLMRPDKELKAFKKVFVKAGESKNVEFEINKSMLEFYTVNNKFEVEPGTFKVYIGNSSETTTYLQFEVME